MRKLSQAEKGLLALALSILLFTGGRVGYRIYRQRLSLTLFDAINRNDAPAVQDLLKRGANPNYLNVSKRVPLEEAVLKRKGRPAGSNLAMVRALLDAGANPNQPGLLRSAVQEEENPLVDLFLERGAVLYLQDLDVAVAHGDTKLVRRLLVAGARVNLFYQTHTPLALLMENPYYLPRPKQLQIAKILLEQKANPNVPSMSVGIPQIIGYTPLGAGAITGGRPMVELLLKAGAQIDGRGIDGWTPLMSAVAYGELEAATYLVLQGADPNLKNRLGKSARDYASERRAKEPKIGKEMVSLLERKATSQ